MHIKKGQCATTTSMKVANDVINVPKSPIRTYHINNINDDEDDDKEPVVNAAVNVPKSPVIMYNIVVEEKEENEEQKEKDKKKKNHDDVLDDVLASGIQNLNLSTQSDSQDEKSDDEDVEISPNFVAKCPTRRKDQLKEEIKTNAKPYPDRQSSQPYRIHSGGTVFEGSYGHDLDNKLPESVAQINEEQTNSSLDGTDLFNILTKEEQDTMNLAIEQLTTSQSIKLNFFQPTDDSQIFQSPNYSTSPSDSNYYTMSSPASGQPSPCSSICSPPPRYNTYHQSEGEMSPLGYDSSKNTINLDNCDWRKPQNKPTKYNVMPNYDRNIPNLSPLNSISSPRIEDQLSPNFYSSSPKYCNYLSFDSESISHDSSSNQLNQESYNITSWNFNALPNQEEIASNIILPSPILNHKSNNDILSHGSTYSSSSAPIRHFNIPKQQYQSAPIFQTPIRSVCLPPTNGRPTKTITIPSTSQQSNNTTTYAQLIPVKSESRKKNIKPGGVSVSEVDLEISGAERLLKRCDTFEKEVAWTKVCLENETEINSINSKNQTKLMQTLQEEPNKKQFFEGIYTRIRRIQKEKRKELLMKRDINGHNALYMAAIWQKNYSELARFIADTYVELGINPNEVYGENDDTLLHIIARSGDEYAKTLADLLRVKHPNSLKKAFDVNRKNKNLLTPLQLAATTHMSNGLLSTLTITNLLIKHGAHLKTQNSAGKTALHLAVQNHCDPNYIKTLLQSPFTSEFINITDIDGNTALHICAANNHISFEKQKEVLNQLKTSGATHTSYNNDGKLPLNYFVSQEKKEEVKILLNKKH